MSKIILISGSPKPDGNTAQLMGECAKVIQEQGVEAEVISFAGMSIGSCTACGKCSETGECDILPDISQSHGVLNPLLSGNSQSLWGAPLKEGDRVIGVLVIGFARPYVWLPTERELLRAIADRSALAINRAEMTDALREREMRKAAVRG